MKPWTITLGLLGAGCLMLAAACGGSGKPADNKAVKAAAKISRPEVPEAYQGKTLPAGASAEEGKTVFDAQCASCHGATGNGRHPDGQGA